MSDIERNTAHTYLPRWCGHQLYDVRETVERVAWILFGAAAAVDDDSTHERPKWAAVHGYDMAGEAYRDLCSNQEKYLDADKVAVDQDYKDRGWTKDENGNRVPTPETLKEMEVSQ